MPITGRPVAGSMSFQNGRSTITNVLDDCMYLVRSSAIHRSCEKMLSSSSIWVVSSQPWQVASTASCIRSVAQDESAAAPANGRPPRARHAAVQALQRSARRPGAALADRQRPQAPWQPLGAAADQPLVGVAVRDDDPQDLEHGVGEVGVPPSGTEPDEPEHLAVAEWQLGEARGGGDEVVKGPAVPQRHELVPSLLQRVDVPRPDGVLERAEADLLKCLLPGDRDLGELRWQLAEGPAMEGLPRYVDDGAARGLGERVGERRAGKPDPVRVVEEGRARDREPHPAEFGDYPVGALELV